MTATLNVGEFKSKLMSIDIVGVASTANAGQGSLANPFGESVNILRGYLVPSVESTGAANLSIGVTTAAASSTDILNADAMNGVGIGIPINCFANDPGAKTAMVPAIWTSAKFLTLTASATMVGFVGTLYLEILRDG
ncbi:hypothetical protein KA005_12500 [bacterium]|nr:hypothetical protein [bacterium]